MAIEWRLNRWDGMVFFSVNLELCPLSRAFSARAYDVLTCHVTDRRLRIRIRLRRKTLKHTRPWQVGDDPSPAVRKRVVWAMGHVARPWSTLRES